MTKRIMMTLLLGGFLNVGATSAMEPLESPKKELSPQEQQAHKMMIFDEAQKQPADSLKKEGAPQYDVSQEVGKALHAVSSNPVLDGTLEYTNPQTKEKVSFKIGTKDKDGMIDLSDKAFGDADKYLVITTDPNAFFANHKGKIVILIAPWSLIHDNLSSPSYAPFQPIMKNWDEKKAPIGIFWREGSWSDKSWYEYQIKLTMAQITLKTLYAVPLSPPTQSTVTRRGLPITHMPHRSSGYTAHIKVKFDLK